MSLKSAQTIAAIEKWFSLPKYQAIATFGSYRWLEQIKKRIDIESAFARNDQDYLKVAIPLLTADPLSSHLVESDLWRGLDKKAVPATVRDLDMADLDQINQLVNQQSDQLTSQPTATLQQLQLRPAALGLSPVAIESYLVVRLDAKDGEIIEGVRKWLKERRLQTPEVVITAWAQELNRKADEEEAQASVRKNTEEDSAKIGLELATSYRSAALTVQNGLQPSDLMAGLQARFEEWYDRKIIPYFDLTAWCRWSGFRLSDAEISALLFDPEITGQDIGLKPTKKVTSEVICEVVVKQLFYLGR